MEGSGECARVRHPTATIREGGLTPWPSYLVTPYVPWFTVVSHARMKKSLLWSV